MFIHAAEPLLLHASSSLACQEISLVATKLTTELAKIFLLPCITSMYADLLKECAQCV